MGAEHQIASHAAGNLKAGNDRQTMYAAVVQCLPYVGFPYALNAIRIIERVPELQ